MEHLLQEQFLGCQDMRGFYDRAGMLATSTNADIALIRSHIAYWSGAQKAERASIKASRGHSYRVAVWGKHDQSDSIVTIRDHFDHRDGVVGYVLG